MEKSHAVRCASRSRRRSGSVSRELDGDFMVAGVPRQSKSKSALLQIAAPAFLARAWAQVSRGKLRSLKADRRGLDGDSLNSFAAGERPRLEQISKAIVSETYEFSPLQPFFIPKPGSTKERLICVPTVSDRIVQRAALSFLNARTEWLQNGVSFGFVPTLGVRDAVKHAIQLRTTNPWVFKTDITAFFDQIDRKLLRDAITKKIKHPSLRPLLLAAMESEVATVRESQTARLKRQGIVHGRGVRQGMPLSPFFANLMLQPFDAACLKKKLPAVRYADDLIFFAKSEEEAKNIEKFCQEELAKLNLNIPELEANSKTQIYGPTQAAEFLGVEFSLEGNGKYQIKIGKAQLTKIKERILGFGNLTELQNRQLDITRFGNSLAAMTAAYSAHYSFCHNIDDLNVSIESWRKKALAAVYAELGINTDHLSEKARWFLSL